MNAPPGGLVLEQQMVMDSPRERIFSALTDSGELARWFGPHGFTMPGIEVDLRVGGSYRFTMQPAESGICLRQYAINAELTGAIGQSRRSDTGPGACVSWPGLNAVSRRASRLTNASRNASIVDIHA